MADRPLVIVTRKLPDVVETRLRELFDAKLNLDDKPFTREELIDAAKTANVLVPTVTDRIDRAVLSQAGPNLKLIAQFGTGVDNIDLDTARNLDSHDPGRQPMQQILREHYGVYTARQHKEVEVTTLDEEEARLLEANLGAPALLMTYLNFTPKGQAYEYRKMIVRGDRSKYYVDVDFPEMLM